MAFKLKYKNLKGVIEQLKGASKKHKKQAEILEKHVDKMKSPLEQDDLDYTGLNFDPSASYTTKDIKIPSFRDIVSLEQQQAYADKVDKRRAKKRKIKEALEKYGGEQYDPEEEMREDMEAFSEEYGDGV